MKKQIRNPEDFEIASKECAGVRRVSALLNRLYPAVTRFPGKCVCCGKWRFFQNDLLYGGTEHPSCQINFRERMVCPVCNLNNRMRSTFQVILREMKRYSKGDLLIYEAVTPFYTLLEKKCREKEWRITGTEYFGDSCQSGTFVNGIRHEDATSLSFEDESFDIIVSNEVFEHIPVVAPAINEMFRVLRPGGTVIFTIPIDPHFKKSLQRAKIENGEIFHLLEPEIHGNPVDANGSLAFWTLGWDILDLMKEAGFSDSYAEPAVNFIYGNIQPWPHLIFLGYKSK